MQVGLQVIVKATVKMQKLFSHAMHRNEISSIINSLKTIKASRFVDVEIKFLKTAESVIAPILCFMINNCFLSSVF